MQNRKFQDSNLKEIVSTILTEIVYSGKSEGWSCNSICIKHMVDTTLLKYNVVDTDDFTGTYELKGGIK